MTDYPDFSPNNYQIISELGRNNLGGRVTYLAEETTTKQQVVIKQFQFALGGATWAEYDAYEQEIAMLQHLNHPGIPKYLDSFQTETGFCMVQEYINAQSLAVSRSWSPREIQFVAIATLEILVYLQSQGPSVIHRDLKPENILVDEKLKIYLVDFGFARLGGGEIAASSAVKGTMGFMPPEQLFNRQLTEASDLYGLGATLICLLTGIKSGDIGNLIDESYRIQFQHLVPPLKRGLISWLEKISAPNPKERYDNAASALAVLKSLDVERLPKVRVSKNKLEFVGEEFRDKVTKKITISNPIPETVLTGRWEVVSHPSDPPHTPYDHPWIEFDSYQFEGNNVECKITVDTSKLLAWGSYHRQLLLHSNSEGESLLIPMVVKPASVEEPDYYNLILTGIVAPFLLLIPGFYFLPTIERILKVNAKKKSVNVLFPLIFSIISAAPFLFLFKADLSMQGLFTALFFLAIATDFAAQMGTSLKFQKLYENLILFGINDFLQCVLIVSLMMLVPLLQLRFGIIGLLVLPWALTILFFAKKFVNYQRRTFLKRNATKNTLAISGLSLSLVLGCLLTIKFLLLNSIYKWFLGEQILITVVAIAPILYFSFLLGKMAIKRQRAIAQYHREKIHLIAPELLSRSGINAVEPDKL